ncbi:MAG TPA: MBL fold metallo-hydrolase [Flavipsychrobacter sp.]|nr:MBL fold metallo-hydrolase [Flavipsychrobacter sp.]
MKISFHGAARTVTGSKHIIQFSSGKKVLLDCGMFQGMGKETLTLNSQWGFDPLELDYVIISHAHIDHVGLLPKLVKEGYNGKIFCTTQTADLAQILLLDSAHIQESDIEHVNRLREKEGRELVKPLYTIEDADKVFPLFHPIDYHTPFKIDDDIELLYTDVGHIVGSAAVNLKLRENGKEVRLTFSGDVGRYNDMLLKSPETFPQADYIIIESTYGDKLHDIILPAADQLLKFIQHTCIEKRGNLIIPAFSVGRTQEILFLLNRLELEHRLPKLKYFVDSPLSTEATELTKHHPECFNKDVSELLKKDNDVFAFEGLHYTKSADESIGLKDLKEPCVIISASGMAEAGRVKHHIVNNINSPNNTILIVGYCEPASLGGRLRSGAKQVSIYGSHYDVNAQVGVIESLSAHGDYEDLSQWLACQDPREVHKLFIVHGEYEVQVNFRERLLKKGFTDVEIPSLHQEIGLGNFD